MKSRMTRIVLGLLLGLGFFMAPASANAQTGNRVLQFTYCWSKTTFGPKGCNSSWPKNTFTLVGTGTSGPAIAGYGSTNPFTGTYQFSTSGNTIQVQFINPNPGTLSLTLNGANYSGGGSNCYRGSIFSDRATGSDLSGVWFGCVQ